MKKCLIKKLIILFVISIVFVSCDTSQIYENNIELNNYTWNKDSIKVFNVDIQDTISAHNIYVNVRNTQVPQSEISDPTSEFDGASRPSCRVDDVRCEYQRLIFQPSPCRCGGSLNETAKIDRILHCGDPVCDLK